MVVTNHTFLFADLVGYTAFTASAGDEAAAEMAIEFHVRVRELLAEHGATEVKTLGDGVMLRCECPKQAMLLAARIVWHIGDEVGLLPVRTGVSTGTAVQRDGDWYGGAVNVAARLCAVAAEGEALACDATRGAAADLEGLALAARGSLALKNLPSPVVAFAAQSDRKRPRFTERAEQPSPEPAPDETPSTAVAH